MRSYLGDFEMVAPRRLAEALSLVGEKKRAGAACHPLAGATDLYVLLNAGQLPPATLVSLHAVEELAEHLLWDGDRLRLGALATFTDTRRDAGVARRLPLLVAASRELGALQIQNRATWAGNVANASPAADGVPVLLAYDAVLELASERGRREVPLETYFTGYKESVRSPDELIVSIAVSSPARGARHYFRKVGTRRMQAISKVVAAGVVERDASGTVTRARLALGSVAPTTVRARRVEESLLGRRIEPDGVRAACEAARADAAPIDDLRSTRAYRARVTERLVREFLEPLLG